MSVGPTVAAEMERSLRPLALLLAAIGISMSALASPAVCEAQPGGSTISGPQIEELLRANLAAARGTATDPSQIRCPATREYVDGDVARCTVPVGNGNIEILLVTLFQEGANWRFAIDIQ
jgi:hypothetical protein